MNKPSILSISPSSASGEAKPSSMPGKSSLKIRIRSRRRLICRPRRKHFIADFFGSAQSDKIQTFLIKTTHLFSFPSNKIYPRHKFSQCRTGFPAAKRRFVYPGKFSGFRSFSILTVVPAPKFWHVSASFPVSSKAFVLPAIRLRSCLNKGMQRPSGRLLRQPVLAKRPDKVLLSHCGAATILTPTPTTR